MDLDLCERYLWALSTSPNIKNHVIREIYEMVKAAKHPNEKLWQTLVLTLPAMAHRFNERCGNCDHELVEDTVKFLNESMIACKSDDDGCQTIYLRGLLNIPNDIMKTTLVEKALNSKGRVGVVAMRFIEKLGPKSWDDQVLKAAEQVYMGNHTYDSSARCIALDILLKSQPNDLLLTRIISLLERPYSTRELKEYLFQRLNELSETDPQFQQRVKRIIKNNGYNHYNYIAQGGFSTAFRRDFMEGGALSTTQEVMGGLLKRGNVYVNLEKETGMEPVFTLGLFSSGLSSFMASSEEETEDEVASGGLELNVLGVGLRPFVFFDGHGELMGHVWSGTASSLTPAFQALILLEDEVVKIPLAIGYYASVTTEVGASVDLSAKIEISLWNRNAESLVQNKAGLAFDTRIDIDTSFVKTTAEYNIFSEPEVHLESYIEFSGDIALCLQFQQPSSTIRYNTYRIERIPGSKHKLRRSRYRTIPVPGKTYALNAKNNEMCNVILTE
uniref:Microsomal triglyceride transfer protein large subunit n=1 Tax=Lygus hesperus TaxID=30085 RepID=A0A0A9Y1A6_LYGHE